MTKLLVFTKTHHAEVDIDTTSLRKNGLAPQSARRASYQAQLLPCWVTDGNIVYRVTKGLINIWPIERLRVRELMTMLDWIKSDGIK